MSTQTDNFQMQNILSMLQQATLPYGSEQLRLAAMREWLRAMGEMRWYEDYEVRDRVLLAVVNLSMGQRP